jgi:hypothetical protein
MQFFHLVDLQFVESGASFGFALRMICRAEYRAGQDAHKLAAEL